MSVQPFDETLAYLSTEAQASLKHVRREDVDALLRHIQGARHVVMFGRGRSGLVARTFAIRLHHLGFRAFVVGETSTPPVSDEDLLLLVSGSGETFSVTLTAQIARDLGAKVVCVTGGPSNRLAELSDRVIVLPTSQGEEQARVAPLGTAFELAAHLFFDGVVAELMAALGEDEAGMRSRHATLE